jgi:hypothetical protein
MTHSRSRLSATLALAAAGAALVGACSSATPAPATHTDPLAAKTTTAAATAAPAAGGNACELVTEQEVGTALGTDPGVGSPFTSHGASQCQYGTYQTAFVLVNLTPAQGATAYDMMHGKTAGNGVAVADVAGVGDRAFEISGPNADSIYFNKGDALVLVTVTIHTATSPPKDQALALARAAAGRS